mgnify:CR=1 FL=1
MRILFVTLPQNQHSVRHINTLSSQGWDIHVFPAYDVDVSPYFRNITAYHITDARPPDLHPSVRIVPYYRTHAHTDDGHPTQSIKSRIRLSVRNGIATFRQRFNRRYRRNPKVRQIVAATKRLLGIRGANPVAVSSSVNANPQISVNRADWLARVIHDIEPDLIHAQTIFTSGYLMVEARRIFLEKYPDKPFPKWIIGNWGLDIHFFQHAPSQIGRIKEVLETADYYTCECERDVRLARDLGFKGVTLPVMPIGGGFDIERLKRMRQRGPISRRRLIMIKGYQNLVGRSLTAFRALELCADVLKGYRIAVYLLPNEYYPLMEVISHKTGVPIDIIPESPHDTILKLHGQARISIGLSVSDAISTSMLEAIIMGSFPIQSYTACADEWIVDGQTGLLVDPEDPNSVAQALRTALLDDKLVDEAAEINLQTAERRLDRRQLDQQLIEMYRSLVSDSKPVTLYSH